ncbi:unnamed protein product, partial [Prorocentrum cordatum]
GRDGYPLPAVAGVRGEAARCSSRRGTPPGCQRGVGVCQPAGEGRPDLGRSRGQ